MFYLTGSYLGQQKLTGRKVKPVQGLDKTMWIPFHDQFRYLEDRDEYKRVARKICSIF